MHVPTYLLMIFFGYWYTCSLSTPVNQLVLKQDDPTIPSMVMTRARFLADVEKLLPTNLVDITAHIREHIGKPLTDWTAGDSTIVVFHRGFTFAGPDGLLVEQSRTGIEAVFKAGGRNVEVDTMPLRGAQIRRLTLEEISRAARNFVMFHDLNLKRQYGTHGYAELLDWESASKLRISYEVFDQQGQPTDKRFYTEEAPLNLKDYFEDIQFCYSRSSTIHDMRERTPLQIITQMIAMITSKIYVGAENCMIEGNIYHIYASGFPGGGRHLAELLRGTLDQLHIKFELKRIHIIPVVSASMMHLVVSEGKHEGVAMHRYEGCVNFLESFMEDFTIPAFNVGARMLDQYVNATTLQLNSRRIERDFKGQLTEQVKRVFVDDHLLHRIKEGIHAKHGIPIMTTNKAAPTSWGSHVYQHWYRDVDLELMDPTQNIEDFVFQQQSFVTTPIESGYHIILTDFPQEILALLAFRKTNISVPQNFSQKLMRTLLSQENLQIVLQNIGKLSSIAHF